MILSVTTPQNTHHILLQLSRGIDRHRETHDNAALFGLTSKLWKMHPADKAHGVLSDLDRDACHEDTLNHSCFCEWWFRDLDGHRYSPLSLEAPQ